MKNIITDEGTDVDPNFQLLKKAKCRTLN